MRTRARAHTHTHTCPPRRLQVFLMMRTLRDMNMSKFVAEDVPLFLSLIDDLFPGLKAERNSFPEVRERARGLPCILPYLHCDDHSAPSSHAHIAWSRATWPPVRVAGRYPHPAVSSVRATQH
jgi:hypothetical protein